MIHSRYCRTVNYKGKGRPENDCLECWKIYLGADLNRKITAGDLYRLVIAIQEAGEENYERFPEELASILMRSRDEP